MPLYEYMLLDEKGNQTGEIVEEIMPVGTEVIVSPTGQLAVRKPVSLIAKTSGRWGDTNKKWDPQLGVMVGSQHDIDRACREKGLVDTSDLDRAKVIKRINDNIEAKRFFDDENIRWESACKKFGVPTVTDGSMEEQLQHAKGWAKAWDEVLPPTDSAMSEVDSMAAKM